MTTRTIQVAALTRVEGEGGLHIQFQGDRLEQVQLKIFEPPRLFEALLRGRRLEEVPDITARICGICPVAYQMSSVHALEAALGVQITPEVRQLRRLLYCGEWIESHALHVHLLHAPDFLGYDSGIAMAAEHRAEVERGLRLKKHGNQLLEKLGGRAIHPINVAVGGFYRAPRRDDLRSLIPDFEWGLQAAIDTTRWVAGFDFPEIELAYESVALQHPEEYGMNEGDIASSQTGSIPAAEFERHFEEIQVPHSTALQAVHLDTGKPYLVGPLARVNLNRTQLSPSALKLADEIGFETPCRNPFRMIVARGLELVHAYEVALEILRNYEPFQPARVAYEPQVGSGCAATEAPRGLLYHRYEVDAEGLVVAAKIVPPTSQNQARIEEDLQAYVPQLSHLNDDALAKHCESLVRSYDPCISCSTHFLKVDIQRT